MEQNFMLFVVNFCVKKNCGKIVRFYQTGCLSILTACDEAYNKLRG